jgi:hypothetical protein
MAAVAFPRWWRGKGSSAAGSRCGHLPKPGTIRQPHLCHDVVDHPCPLGWFRTSEAPTAVAPLVGAFRFTQLRSEPMDNPFRQTRDPKVRAERYQRLARQYFDLAKEASSPSLRSDYQRTAEEYRVRAQGELRLLEREGSAATARS